MKLCCITYTASFLFILPCLIPVTVIFVITVNNIKENNSYVLTVIDVIDINSYNYQCCYNINRKLVCGTCSNINVIMYYPECNYIFTVEYYCNNINDVNCLNNKLNLLNHTTSFHIKCDDKCDCDFKIIISNNKSYETLSTLLLFVGGMVLFFVFITILVITDFIKEYSQRKKKFRDCV